VEFFSFSLIDWDVNSIKQWALTLFNEEVVGKCEKEEIDGKALQSEIILTEQSRLTNTLTLGPSFSSDPEYNFTVKSSAASNQPIVSLEPVQTTQWIATIDQ